MALVDVQYIRRWNLAFENYSGVRREPLNGIYSLRTTVTHRKPSGAEIKLEQDHRLVWIALLHGAKDLSYDAAVTWMSIESISQETGLSADVVRKRLVDLEDLGWLKRTKRKYTTTRSRCT